MSSWRGSLIVLTLLTLVHCLAGRSAPVKPGDKHGAVRQDSNGNPLPTGAFARQGAGEVQRQIGFGSGCV